MKKWSAEIAAGRIERQFPSVLLLFSLRRELHRSSQDNHVRAVRYRQLALIEPDPGKAALLRKIADEAEGGVLCTSTKLPCRPGLPYSPKALSGG